MEARRRSAWKWLGLNVMGYAGMVVGFWAYGVPIGGNLLVATFVILLLLTKQWTSGMLPWSKPPVDEAVEFAALVSEPLTNEAFDAALIRVLRQCGRPVKIRVLATLMRKPENDVRYHVDSLRKRDVVYGTVVHGSDDLVALDNEYRKEQPDRRFGIWWSVGWVSGPPPETGGPPRLDGPPLRMNSEDAVAKIAEWDGRTHGRYEARELPAWIARIPEHVLRRGY